MRIWRQNASSGAVIADLDARVNSWADRVESADTGVERDAQAR